MKVISATNTKPVTIPATLGEHRKTSRIAIGILMLAFTLVVLSLIYWQRIRNYSIDSFSILIIYSLVVTPVVMFKFINAYVYKPIPDLGFRPSVSVIIPAYNEEKDIRLAIDALLKSDYPNLEVIVVDDGSTDNTWNIISNIRGINALRMAKNTGKRFAFAKGVRQSNGEIIVCLDSDSIVKKDAIKFLVQPFKDRRVYCTCGHGEVYNKDRNILTRFQRVWYADCFRVMKAMESRFGMVTCCSGLLAAYRREGILRVINDWLNEKFLGANIIASDDRHLTNLMLRLGKFVGLSSEADDRTLTSFALKNSPFTKSMYQSNAIAYTIVPDNLSKFTKQQLRWGRGSLRGMLFASSFFWRRPIRQSILFYLLLIVNYMSPAIMVFNLIVLPLLGYWYLGVIYFMGLFLIHGIYAINDRYLVKNITLRDVVYRALFPPMSTFVALIYFYGWLTLWKGKKWMTR